MNTRGLETRELLVETALRLFREEGFEAATMRRIAVEAGVSLGNAYHYFASKDDLIHELYLKLQLEHRALAIPQLREGESLAQNLHVVLRTGFEVMAPYHAFGTSFVQIALPTASASGPFSIGAAPAREVAIDLMRSTTIASRTRTTSTFEERLPTLLWIVYLAVTLFWVADSSANQTRTRALVDLVAPIVSKSVSLSRLPFARSLTDDVARLASFIYQAEVRRPSASLGNPDSNRVAL